MNSMSKLATLFVLGTSMALHGGTKLSKAAIDGNLDAVKERIQAGEGVNEIDKWGWTALMWAVYYRQLPITNYLLEHKADPNIQATAVYGAMSKGCTPLTIAGYYGLDDHAAALVKHGAYRDLADASGKTATDYAKQYDFASTAAIIAKGKAKPAGR